MRKLGLVNPRFMFKFNSEASGCRGVNNFPGIVRDKTMADKLLHILNKLVVETLVNPT